MTSPVTVVIGGLPTAKGRPRMTRLGIAYTPAATRKYEAHGRLAAQQAMNGRAPINVPVKAEIMVDLPVPTSWSTKRRDAALRGEIRPTSRLDVDNFIKCGFDTINNIVVTDDSLIVELTARFRKPRHDPSRRPRRQGIHARHRYGRTQNVRRRRHQACAQLSKCQETDGRK
jgi:Holliday junction resolvase RusA-like endonuclease